MYQNGGGGMAQFGQMGLNQFSQMQTPQAGMMMPMMMPQTYGQPMYPQQMMMPMMAPQQQQMMQNNSQVQDNPDDAMQQRQFAQNQGANNNAESMGRRNMSQPLLSINQPVSKPSEGFQALDRYGRANKQKEYAQMLEFQLDLKKQKKEQLKSLEQMQIDNLKNERIKSQVFAAKGQLQRDEFGNIVNTKMNPANPNYQPLDWFSHVAHKDEFQNQNMDIGQQNSVGSLANVNYLFHQA